MMLDRNIQRLYRVTVVSGFFLMLAHAAGIWVPK